MTRDLEIVIVNFNTSDHLDACLESIHAVVPERLDRVVVVDNGSSDGSALRVRARWSRVHVVALDANIGFGAANNIALRIDGPPLVLLLNSDTRVPAGAIDTLAERLDETGSVAAGPRLVDAEGRPELSFGEMLSPWAEVKQAMWGRLARQRNRMARRLIAERLATERTVDWVSGACLLARRDRLQAAGGFDERYFMYEEDVDLCATLRAQGGSILYTPRAEIVHLRGASVKRASGASTAAYDRSHMAFYEKHAPAWAPWLRAWQRLRGRAIR